MDIELLVSLPPAAARLGREAVPAAAYADSDPPGRQLGSGGGTAHLLERAWRALGEGRRFEEWLSSSRKLIVHASGQSRRLPAYAAIGKSCLPIPPLEGLPGQKPAQTLVDLQREAFAHLLRHAPESCVLAVACGDTLVRYDRPMPVFPEADVTVVGIPASPEEASGHGVLFAPRREPGAIELFLQKPTPARISELASEYSFSLDSGVWLFSARAVAVLMRKCGWDEASQSFAGGAPAAYELYDRFGTALGRRPANPDPEIGALSCAVLPLSDGRFYHFGTNRSVLHSVAQLAHPAEERRAFGHVLSSEDEADRIVLNADAPALPAGVHPLWIENASVPPSWTLSGEHVLTGLPPNAWTVSLPRGVCVDAVGFAGADAAGAGLEALRVYGFDDPFKGRIGDPATVWLGRPFAEWMAARGLSFEEAALDPASDVQDAPLFPLLDWSDPANGAVLSWMAGSPGLAPAAAAEGRRRWLAARRVSATDLVQAADLPPRLRRRDALCRAAFAAQGPSEWAASAMRLDLAATADDLLANGGSAPAPLPASAGLAGVHDAMFRERLGGAAGPRDGGPFERLRDLVVGETALSPVRPSRDILDDQIVWGRAPARLDLAGGWSDTPPYCMEHGGRVANVAVDLNGQPPIQVFARLLPEPKIVLHSIDLGVGEEIGTYEELSKPSHLGAFSIPRAALRLAGFDPRFAAGPRHASLEAQLRAEFGGGLEISTLAAIPKGSGLGTSSILAVTVLGVLGETCALGWSLQDLFSRTSALEQLLSSGGGWQDQVGGAVPGAKLATTRPGPRQQPDVRYLPEGMLADLVASGRALLYYTGITRVARSILAEIVRGIFLNDGRVLGCIGDIACNADFAADAIQRADAPALFEAVRRSWALNCELDSGTCPPAVEPVADVFRRHGAAFKLLGAGGGGYMLGFAPDPASAAAIRDELRRNPPNSRARFVRISLSKGLQITRS